MNTKTIVSLAILVLFASTGLVAAAGEAPAEQGKGKGAPNKGDAPEQSEPDIPKLKARKGRTPATTSGAGTRDASQVADPMRVHVIAPASALEVTGSRQPKLYYYLSMDTKLPFRLVVHLPDRRQTELVVCPMPNGASKGLHSLDLANLPNGQRVELKAGTLETPTEYVWVADFSTIEHPGVASRCRFGVVDPASSPKGASGHGLAFSAENGLWFDYVAALFDRATKPGDNVPEKATLAALLKPEGMDVTDTADGIEIKFADDDSPMKR